MANNSFISIVAIGFLLCFFAASSGVESVGVSLGREGNDIPPANEIIDLYKSYKIGRKRVYDTNHDILKALTDVVKSGAGSVGVCLGREGDDIPPANEIIDLYKSYNIGGIRVYDTNHDVLEALRGSNIPVIIDVVESDLTVMASNPSAASGWVRDTIQAYANNVNFRYIAVGNELIPGSHPQDVLPAMQNVQNALQSLGLQDRIKVSTSVSTGVIDIAYPPSAGTFSANVLNSLQPIIAFLAATGAPLLVNVYPYFSYINNPEIISLDYALFTSPGAVVSDGALKYQNLFDSMVDVVFSALERAGGGGVNVVVSETGWPSGGGDVATPQNAQTYYSNLINHVKQGTPKRPGVGIETYLFSMFDEDWKQPHGTENNYGIFYDNKQPKYNLNF